MVTLPVLNNDSLERALRAGVRGDVRFARHERMLYATDASIYQVEPIGVVIPDSTDDAVAALRVCAERGVPVLPRGGGTSLAGQCTNQAVVIDLSARCRGVLSIDAPSLRCRVEPGLTFDELNEILAPHALLFAPDPATSRHANIGGCIGNNAAGARSIRYGRTSENLFGVRAALPDGRVGEFSEGSAIRDPVARELGEKIVSIVRAHAALIRERFPTTIRRNAGYNLDLILDQIDRSRDGTGLDTVNLAHVLAGSEGTLALTLEADLALHPVPTARGLGLLGFDSLDAAIDAVPTILALQPTAVELLDDLVLSLAEHNTEYRRYVALMPRRDEPPRAVLYVEFSSEDGTEGVHSQLDHLRSTVPSAAFRACTSSADMLDAWALRKAGEPLLHAVAGDRKPYTFVEDNAVPVERLGEFVREFRRIVERHGTRAAFFAHASVGVLHVRPLLNLRDEGDRQAMLDIAIEVADLAKNLGGVMSGEHGDGRVRTPLLERYYGPELMRAFREVKHAFDPRNLLNPGNIVGPQPIESIAQHTRLRPVARPALIPDVRTYFRFEHEHGLPHAAELCNGAGVCRKKTGGTMCPSYRATLDERHSTRGRGNALRLAISGQFADGGSAPGWNDPGTLATLDLCLSCKACKSECPSNVDIARLKSEYLAQSYDRAGTPLAARLMGNVRRLNRLGSLAPGLANAAQNSPPIRALMQRVLGIDRRRSLPRFGGASNRFVRTPRRDARPAVLLFADCFTTYNEPKVAFAAARVLSAFGYRVIPADAGCCGRSTISLGLLPRAIRTVDRTAVRLERLIATHEPAALVVLEPSCLSAIRDDWTDLRLRTPPERVGAIAALSTSAERFLEERWEEHPVRPALAGAGKPVLLHQHCHTKALDGPVPGAALLRRILGDRLLTPDTGCCGMAGAFGFASQRYDLSMAIASQSILPALRDHNDAIVVAPGTSCRHQIHDAGRRGALHPVQLLDYLLDGVSEDARA